MNKHIELVKKYLEDNDSVSLIELRANAYDSKHVADAARAAYDAALAAADVDFAQNAAGSWVERYYEELKIKVDRSDEVE